MYCYLPAGFISHARREIEGGIVPAVADRIGGVPAGLPGGTFPPCQQCGLPMTFVAQFGHDAVRLDLKREGRILFAFSCVRDCDAWNPQSGATACFIVEPEVVDTRLVILPDQAVVMDFYLRVQNWKRKSEGVSDKQANGFLQAASFLELERNHKTDKVQAATKLNGVPSWLQIPHDPYIQNGRFVGQISVSGVFGYNDDPLIKSLWGGGIGYLFLNEREATSLPQVRLFYQST